ncbi:uncharacterized protein LOC110020704 [Phalaenopsis equestris]|uniref:uncharacterized protein LOC110020704 n=1 Tax=Phalaenopsis equestris TaxID=78828 RepID=UPI0009E2683C|nr:uncharacterized protein LOC110020704 [Phalaenopsis equestris]
MHIQRAFDALMCQVFPVTLKGQARTWFYSLSGGTFGENRRIIKDSSYLSGIHQSEGESLNDYFHGFSTEARHISGVDPVLLRGVFLGGLRPGPFCSSLMRETVRSYADLVYHVDAQISAYETIIAHKEQFEQFGGKCKNNVGDTNQISQRK